MSATSDFLDFVKTLEQDNKICLFGKYWDDAFTIITGSKERNNSILPNPLILSGWWFSSDEDKKERFLQHLEYGFKNGKWELLQAYLSELPDKAWHFKT